MSEQSVTDFYAHDHDRLDGLFKQFQTLKRTEGAQATKHFAGFQSGLTRHIAWEEELLFPAFESKTGMRNTGPTAVMRMEHREIKQLLAVIADGIQNGVATDTEEQQLLSVLGSHNEKEEGILYPAIDQHLSDSERAAVFAKMERVPLGA